MYSYMPKISNAPQSVHLSTLKCNECCTKKDRISWLRRVFSPSPEAPCGRVAPQDDQEMYAFPKRNEERSAWSGA